MFLKAGTLGKRWEDLSQECLDQSVSKAPTVKGRYTEVLPTKAFFSAFIPGCPVGPPGFLTCEEHKLNPQSALNSQVYNDFLY